MSRTTLSSDSIEEATRNRARFSGHGRALGAAGHRAEGDGKPGAFLSSPGDSIVVTSQSHGFGDIVIGAAWDNTRLKRAGFLQKIMLLAGRKGVDIDLGCLYELADGRRGAVQAFGNLSGSYEASPFIFLPRDEQTGARAGFDENLRINGAHWNQIKRVLVYVYIYGGAPHWESVRPQIHVTVPGEDPLIVTPAVSREELPICAVASLENVSGAIKLANHSEYFHGHAGMDRAFGFGLEWDDGEK